MKTTIHHPANSISCPRGVPPGTPVPLGAAPDQQIARIRAAQANRTAAESGG